MKWFIVLSLGLFLLSTAVAAEQKPINVATGQEFKIALESNPSTGNQWLIARPLDESLLKLLGTEYKRGRSGTAGAGGHDVLSFKALGEGKTQIYLKYGRLWEKNDGPTRTTNFVVVITKTLSAQR
jgi:inhibitor of cysteine peptidase